MADGLEAFDQAVAGEPQPEIKAQTPKVTARDLKQAPFVTGDLSKALAPSVLTKKNMGLDAFDAAYEKAAFGYTRSKPQAILPYEPTKEVVEKNEKSGLSAFDSAIADGDMPLRPKSYDPKSGSEFFHSALSVLSVDENLIVKGMSKAFGLKDRKDLSDYTYTNMFKELGMPDNTMTDAIGLTASILGSPSTYLSFGVGTAAKIGKAGAEVVALSSRGKKVANSIIKDRVEKELATQAEAAAAKGVAFSERKASQELAQKIAPEVHSELIQKFKSVRDPKVELKGVSKEVADAHDKIFDLGGMKLFGTTILEGKTVAKMADQVGLPKVMQAIKESDTVGPMADYAAQTYNQTKDVLGKMFVPFYKVEKELIETWDSTQKISRAIKLDNVKEYEAFFSGLNKEERKEFSKVALDASKLGEKVTVSAGAKSPKVQDKLDQFYAQGKYSGGKSIADELADRSKLVEDKRLANWFPGIIEEADISDLKLAKDYTPSEKLFLSERRKAYEATYTADPVKALAYRKTEIMFAEMQDHMYDDIVKKGMGGLYKGKTPPGEGYALLRRPMRKSLNYSDNVVDATDDLIKRGDEPTYWVKQEFADHYNALIRDQGPSKNPLSQFTNTFKRAVTTYFPSFYARNFNSNIVLNAASIGRQALNPKTHALSLDMVRGKNLDKAFINDIGERLSLKDVLEEAKVEGAMKDFFQDLGGEGLSPKAQKTWIANINKANPFDKDFKVVQWGGKLNTAIENQARMVNYLTWRQKGLSPKLAAMEANEAMFDYAKLTDFEQQYAKMVIPFYTFSRKNMEAQMRLFAHRPGAIMGQIKAFRDLGPTNKQWEGYPEWVQNKLALNFGKKLVTGFGLPIEDVLELGGSGFADIARRTNPILRYSMEKFVTGRDLYTGRRIEEINNANEFKFVAKAATNRNLPDPIRKAASELSRFLKLEIDDHGKVVGNPDYLHMLRNSFTSRFQSTVGLLGKDDKTGFEKALQYTLGFVTVPRDIELAVSIAKRKYGEEFVKEARRMNVKIMDKPIGIGPDKFAVDIFNSYFHDVQKEDSKRAIHQMMNESLKELKYEQKGRIAK